MCLLLFEGKVIIHNCDKGQLTLVCWSSSNNFWLHPDCYRLHYFALLICLKTNPDRPFTMLEPQDQEIGAVENSATNSESDSCEKVGRASSLNSRHQDCKRMNNIGNVANCPVGLVKSTASGSIKMHRPGEQFILFSRWTPDESFKSRSSFMGETINERFNNKLWKSAKVLCLKHFMSHCKSHCKSHWCVSH